MTEAVTRQLSLRPQPSATIVSANRHGINLLLGRPVRFGKGFSEEEDLKLGLKVFVL